MSRAGQILDSKKSEKDELIWDIKELLPGMRVVIDPVYRDRVTKLLNKGTWKELSALKGLLTKASSGRHYLNTD